MSNESYILSALEDADRSFSLISSLQVGELITPAEADQLRTQVRTQLGLSTPAKDTTDTFMAQLDKLAAEHLLVTPLKLDEKRTITQFVHSLTRLLKKNTTTAPLSSGPVHAWAAPASIPISPSYPRTATEAPKVETYKTICWCGGVYCPATKNAEVR